MKLLKKACYLITITLLSFTFNTCDLFQTSVQLSFEHYWDDETIGLGLLGTEFTTESGEVIIIDDIQYIVSEIRLKRVGRNEVYTVSAFRFVSNPQRWFVSVSDVPGDDYEISFVFGLRPELNVQNPNLNLPESFEVPQELGGGYNFMQINGRYQDAMNTFQPFEFHVTNAVDATNGNNIQIEDTSYEVNLGTYFFGGGLFVAGATVKVNIAEWFKNPNTWNFSELNSDLTTNYEAQIKMKENGQNAFSVINVFSD